MPAIVKLPLPPGKVGVHFKGSPPVVTKVQDDSPVRGKIKAGYIVLSMTLSDGTLFEGFSTPELVSALNEYSAEEGRKLQMRMEVPDHLEIACPEGDLGMTLADVDGKAVVTRIASGSPLKKDMRVGLGVDKLILEDGMVVTGSSADEFTEFISDDNKSSGRVLVLANPKLMASPKAITLPHSKTVELPVGMLGVSFKNREHTIITGLTKESPLRGKVRVGMAVDSVTMTDGTEFRGLNAHDLSDALKSSIDSEGRKMLLKHPASKDLPTLSTTKVYLPDLGNAGEMGISFAGDPAAFKEVAETSPVYGKARRGQVVLTIGWADGTEYDTVDADDLEDILQDSSGTEGRYLLLKNMPEPPANELIIPLPAGKIGLVFKGSPPSVIRINPDSPLYDLSSLVGMVVDTVTLKNGEVTYELDAHELTGILNANIESEGRVVRFINPATTELSIPPTLEKPDEMEVILPAGKLGVMFKGKAPCKVSSLSKTSPLRAVMPIGMGVDSLTVGADIHIDMDATTVAGILSATSSIEGRILKLKNPDLEGVVFQKMLNSIEVPLPSGKLGVSLKGSPPMPTKYAEGSPVKGVFPSGMFIDLITMSDGTIMAGLSTAELVAVLADSADETERTLTFKNPKTKEPSPPGIILPDIKKVRLPSGKIGVFFKGRDMARVSRLQPDSTVRNLLRVGMVVDVLVIPGGKTYAGLTAKEVARVLFDTIEVEGRIMILKNPMTTKLSSRDIMDNDDGSVITEAEDGPDDVSQIG